MAFYMRIALLAISVRSYHPKAEALVRSQRPLRPSQPADEATQPKAERHLPKARLRTTGKEILSGRDTTGLDVGWERGSW